MRWLVGVLALGLFAAGCGRDVASKADVAALKPSSDAVTYLWPQIVFKDFWLRDIESSTACEAAGFFWIDHPQDGRSFRAGQGCYRYSGRLPDAGKACEFQTDCIGNCLVPTQGGKISSAKCQETQAHPLCSSIRDGAELYPFVTCPIFD